MWVVDPPNPRYVAVVRMINTEPMEHIMPQANTWKMMRRKCAGPFLDLPPKMPATAWSLELSESSKPKLALTTHHGPVIEDGRLGNSITDGAGHRATQCHSTHKLKDGSNQHSPSHADRLGPHTYTP